MVAGAFVNPNGKTQNPNRLPGAKRDFVHVAFLEWDEGIGIPEVLLSISEISGKGYRIFTGALLGAW